MSFLHDLVETTPFLLIVVVRSRNVMLFLSGLDVHCNSPKLLMVSSNCCHVLWHKQLHLFLLDGVQNHS